MVFWPEVSELEHTRYRMPPFGYSRIASTLSGHHKTSEMEMINFFRIIGVGAVSPPNWLVGQPGR
jgi:hypothetical protein